MITYDIVISRISAIFFRFTKLTGNDKDGGIEIYQSSDGDTEVQVTFDNDIVWLNQEQPGSLCS